MGNKNAKGQHGRSIMVLGLYEAGKTSLLYRLKHGDEKEVPPYAGSESETMNIDVSGFVASYWDIGMTRDSYRPIWTIWFHLIEAFVYMIDSTNKERLDEALDELITHVLLNDQTKNKVIMILANKQDLPDAIGPKDIEEELQKKFEFPSRSTHTVFVLPCSVRADEGVKEAIGFFSRQIRLKKAGIAQAGLIPYSEGMVKDLGSLDRELEKAEMKKKQVFNVKEQIKHSFSCMRPFFYRQ